MKPASAKEIKDELKKRSPKELLELCLRLSRFKKENKELLTYILFESDDEVGYIESIKQTIDDQFNEINKKSFYYIRKGLRKVLTTVRKYSRLTDKKETEVELLLYFCQRVKVFKPSILRSPRLTNLYITQIESLKKKISTLHEDLQFDYNEELQNLVDS